MTFVLIMGDGDGYTASCDIVASDLKEARELALAQAINRATWARVLEVSAEAVLTPDLAAHEAARWKSQRAARAAQLRAEADKLLKEP